MTRTVKACLLVFALVVLSGCALSNATKLAEVEKAHAAALQDLHEARDSGLMDAKTVVALKPYEQQYRNAVVAAKGALQAGDGTSLDSALAAAQAAVDAMLAAVPPAKP